MKRKSAPVLTLILVIIALGFYIHSRNVELREPLVFGVIAAALITFFWFLSEPTDSQGAHAPEDGTLRRAIAASLVVAYLVLVATFAFWSGPSEPLTGAAQQLVTSFTTIVGIVIAFYFGSSAYVEAKGRGRTASSLGAPAEAEKLQSAQSSPRETSKSPPR